MRADILLRYSRDITLVRPRPCAPTRLPGYLSASGAPSGPPGRGCLDHRRGRPRLSRSGPGGKISAPRLPPVLTPPVFLDKNRLISANPPGSPNFMIENVKDAPVFGPRRLGGLKWAK